jgi:hypothetical protein
VRQAADELLDAPPEDDDDPPPAGDDPRAGDAPLSRPE